MVDIAPSIADQLAGISVNPSRKESLQLDQRRRVCLPRRSAWTPGNACTTGAGFKPLDRLRLPPLPIGRFGNSQVGSVEGPGLVNLSAGMSKSLLDHGADLSSRWKAHLPTC